MEKREPVERVMFEMFVFSKVEFERGERENKSLKAVMLEREERSNMQMEVGEERKR
jgi:hypothetical protein